VPSPESEREFAEDVSAAFLSVLDRLAPTERAAFLLREVFDYNYSEVAQILGKASRYRGLLSQRVNGSDERAV
jgi:RNA polymerase sigma-70 factor (ECF subfamily)